MAITFTQIVDAIKTTLATATGISEGQSGDTITESIQNLPLVQVYFESEDTSAFSENDRLTFKAGVRAPHITVYADVYARQRAHIGEDMTAVQTLAEAVRSVLEAQDTKPYFGLSGLQAYRWRSERVTFEYAHVKYAGIRFTIEVWVY